MNFKFKMYITLSMLSIKICVVLQIDFLLSLFLTTKTVTSAMMERKLFLAIEKKKKNPAKENGVIILPWKQIGGEEKLLFVSHSSS